jgi:hypothetical protein
MDAQIHLLIAACRIANEKWMIEIEQDKPEPSLGRSLSPAKTSCDLFLDTCYAMEEAVPSTMAGWKAKWQQIVSFETQYDYGDPDYNLGIAQRMLAEYAVLVPVEAIAVA